MTVTVNSSSNNLNATISDSQPMKFEIESESLEEQITVGEFL
jgi:hypothetical protein